MSDESSEDVEISEVNEPTEEEMAEYRRQRRVALPDEMLSIFVSLANENGVGSSVTLTVGGSLISGQIMGRVQWIDELMDHYGDLTSGLRAFRESWVEVVDEIQKAEVAGPYDTMIHLKNARWYSDGTGSGIPVEGAFWRGRLNQVQGWTLGSLGKGEERVEDLGDRGL